MGDAGGQSSTIGRLRRRRLGAAASPRRTLPRPARRQHRCACPWPPAGALAGSIEVFRMIQALPVTVLPAGTDVEANKLRWRKVIERVGTADVTALVEALRRR